MKECISDARPRTDNSDRKRQLTFRGPLGECRKAYEQFIGAGGLASRGVETGPEASERGGESEAAEWEPEWDPVDEYGKVFELQSRMGRDRC